MSFAVAAIVAAVVGAGATIVQGQEAQEAREEENKIRSAQTQIDAQREARKKIKEARVARARLKQAAVATGTVGSSGELGAQSSITTQAATNLAQQESDLTTVQGITDVRQRAAERQTNLQGLRSVAGAAQSIFEQQI